MDESPNFDEGMANAKISRPWFKKKRFVLPLAFFVALIIAGVAGGNKSNTDSSATSAVSTTTDTASAAPVTTPESSTPVAPVTDSWAPKGFNVWTNDSNIAFKWVPNGTCNTYEDNGCYIADFVSETGCSSFYAAINLLDGSGAVIDYSNGTLPSLLPLQIAKIDFQDINGNSKSAQMSEINCG